jgi:hypothetical protein
MASCSILDPRSSIRAGFDLMKELIRRVRAETLDLTPTAESGWYDHQLWSLEPLIVPDRTPEARRLRLDRGYREHLVKLFKGTYALMRETHAGQGAGGRGGYGGTVGVPIFLAPGLTAEPLFTTYRRRARRESPPELWPEPAGSSANYRGAAAPRERVPRWQAPVRACPLLGRNDGRLAVGRRPGRALCHFCAGG